MKSWCNYFITLDFFRCSADSNFLRTLNFHGTCTNPFPFMNLFDVNSLIKYDLNDNEKRACGGLNETASSQNSSLSEAAGWDSDFNDQHECLFFNGMRWSTYLQKTWDKILFFFVHFSATERKHQTSNKSHTVSARVLWASSPLIADYDSQTFFNNYHIWNERRQRFNV